MGEVSGVTCTHYTREVERHENACKGNAGFPSSLLELHACEVVNHLALTVFPAAGSPTQVARAGEDWVTCLLDHITRKTWFERRAAHNIAFDAVVATTLLCDFGDLVAPYLTSVAMNRSVVGTPAQSRTLPLSPNLALVVSAWMVAAATDPSTDLGAKYYEGHGFPVGFVSMAGSYPCIQ